jgi:serine protease Do
LFGQNETKVDSAPIVEVITGIQTEEQPVSVTSAPVSMDFLSNGSEPSSIEQLKAMQDRVRKISDKVFRATVNIQTGGSQGTGIIVSDDGYVLTAAHVIGRPNRPATVVLYDGTRLDATALGINRDVDSGMLKIQLPEDFNRTLDWLDIGESTKMQPGTWLVAIGHPGGLDKKRGMVTRVGRLLQTNEKLIGTDCTLVGGDSGGPLVDMDGYLVGIHSRIGLYLWNNIHVPIDTFSEDWDRLANSEIIGGSNRPFLGLNLKGNTNEISDVEPWEPAELAGLHVADRIIRIEGTEIKDKSDLSKAIKNIEVGQEIEIVIIRKDEEMTLKLKVGER